MPGKQSSIWWKWRWVFSAVVLAALAWILWPNKQVPATSGIRCPEHDIAVHAFDTVIRSIPIAPETGDIPEYHDCQRFRVGQGFGPLVAIWAAQGLGDYFPSLQPGESDRVAYAVAEIRDLGNGGRRPSTLSDDYPPLSIKRGFNCLYLWRRAAPDIFEARIVYQPTATTLGDCAGRRQLDERILAAPKLSVQVTRFSGAGAIKLPSVARWDWDATQAVQYIGIRCGNAWCEVGPANGFTPSKAVALDGNIGHALTAAFEPAADFPASDADQPATQLVKGWYDQQELEVWNSSGKLVPSGVIGTIVPHPVLDAIDNAPSTIGKPSFDGHWEPAAYIYVTGPYHGKKLELEAGVSRLYLCHGPATVCPGAVNTSATTGNLWWSRLVSPSRHETIKSVYFSTHGGGVIPAGAARWRWLETDGTTWVRCGTGCCTDN